jgi:conjugal transfer pilus assembly protein TraK
MVGEAGIPESMVNVLLLPVDVPPVMAHVDVVMTGRMKQKREEMIYNKIAKEEEARAKLREVERELEMGETEIVKTSNPFTDRIANILTEVAREDIPKGFNLKLEHEIPEADLYPCDSTKLVMKHKTVQQLEASKEIIDIVRVTNDLSGLRSVEDEYCIKDGVYAAATFRRSHLLPGQSTEVYILRDKLYHKTRTQEAAKRRPRVTD